jgi:hypothetical protein
VRLGGEAIDSSKSKSPSYPIENHNFSDARAGRVQFRGSTATDAPVRCPVSRPLSS